MAFATVTDLESLLARDLSTDPTTNSQASLVLDLATEYLQTELGQQLEAGTATVTLPVVDGVVALPQHPVTGVSSVTDSDGLAVDYTLADDELTVSGTDSVTVTFSYGFATTPPDLKRWTLVLAAGALSSLHATGSLGGNGIQSERIDDYSRTLYTGTTEGVSPMTMPQRQLDRLRARYGSGSYVTDWR